MRVRCFVVLALLLMLPSVHAGEKRTNVQSSKTSMRVSFELPTGWVLEGPKAWPSFEEWYVGDPRDPTYRFIVRIDQVFARPVGAQQDECDVRDESKDETAGYVKINNHRVRVHAFYNINDTTWAGASLRLGHSELGVGLFRETPAELRHCFPTLLSFMRTFRVEHQ